MLYVKPISFAAHRRARLRPVRRSHPTWPARRRWRWNQRVTPRRGGAVFGSQRKRHLKDFIAPGPPSTADQRAASSDAQSLQKPDHCKPLEISAEALLFRSRAATAVSASEKARAGNQNPDCSLRARIRFERPHEETAKAIPTRKTSQELRSSSPWRETESEQLATPPRSRNLAIFQAEHSRWARNSILLP